MKVCAVIVTYGDRFKFLIQVIEACLKERMNKVILVDNNSAPLSRKKLKELEKQEKRLKVIYLNENKGSAGGYKRGLEEAYRYESCEYIYLLDDDNKPLPGAIAKLVEEWKKIEIPENEKRRTVALLSYREDKEICRLIKAGKNYKNWIRRTDYFLGFHILDFSDKFLTKLRKVFGIERANENIEERLLMPYAPYGGLFFHKNLLEEVGYPNEIFFTYADDHEFTYRITLRGGKIFLVPKSIVIDIDKSWNKDTFGFINVTPSLLRGDDDYRVYLTVRNRLIFEKMYFYKKKAMLFLNKILYLTYLGCMASLMGRFQRFRLIVKGIKDAEDN